ncbi:MAG: hypothetical protein ACRBBW_10150 [Cellvibrionaceae bacterium]
MIVNVGAHSQVSPPTEQSLKMLRFGAHDFAVMADGLEETKALVRQALRVHGYDMQLEFYPGKRLIAQLNNGRLDGDLFRAVNLSRGFENIVRIEEPLGQACLLFYQLGERSSDFSDATLSIGFGIAHGAPAIQALLTSNYPNSTLEYFKKLSNGVDMLEHDRIDVLVITSEEYVKMHRLSRKKIVLTGGEPLGPMYIHLNAKHRQLALDLAPLFKRLKDGANLTLCDQDTLNSLMQRDEAAAIVVKTPNRERASQ